MNCSQEIGKDNMDNTGNIYGYGRISTPKQKSDRQERNIRNAYPTVIRIFIDAYTGRTLLRPEWNKLYRLVKCGDTIVFDEVSRMSRNAEEGFQVYKDLYERGINLVFLKEPHINTESYERALKGAINIEVKSGDEATDSLVNDIMKAVNRFMMIKLEQDIYSAFEEAQREVDYLRQRTKEGIVSAHLNGKTSGRRKGEPQITKKSIESKKRILKYSKDFFGTNTDIDVIKIIGISRNTYYKYKKELGIECIQLDGALVSHSDKKGNDEIIDYAKKLMENVV